MGIILHRLLLVDTENAEIHRVPQRFLTLKHVVMSRTSFDKTATIL